MTRTRKNPRRALRPALALAVLAFAGNASATLCGTPSPALERLGTDYLLLDEEIRPATGGLEPRNRSLAVPAHPRRPLPVRLSHLEAALETAPLDGIDGERVRCHGIGTARREVRWRFGLEQLERVETPDGETVLTAFERRHTVASSTGDDRLVAGVLVAEVIDVPPPGTWHRSTDGTALRANRRFRRAGAGTETCTFASRPARAFDTLPGAGAVPGDDIPGIGRCSQLLEIDTTARVVGGAIEIEQVFYVGGRWSESTLWRLRS